MVDGEGWAAQHAEALGPQSQAPQHVGPARTHRWRGRQQQQAESGWRSAAEHTRICSLLLGGAGVLAHARTHAHALFACQGEGERVTTARRHACAMARAAAWWVSHRRQGKACCGTRRVATSNTKVLPPRCTLGCMSGSGQPMPFAPAGSCCPQAAAGRLPAGRLRRNGAPVSSPRAAPSSSSSARTAAAAPPPPPVQLCTCMASKGTCGQQAAAAACELKQLSISRYRAR